MPQGLCFPSARGQPQLLRVARASLMRLHTLLVGLHHGIPRPTSQRQKQGLGLGELAEVTLEPPEAELGVNSLFWSQHWHFARAGCSDSSLGSGTGRTQMRKEER